MLNIVWFKRDLRVADHLPLLTAASEGMVVPLFIIEPEYWARPTSSARQWRFVARALAALRSQLAVIGAPLVVRVGDTSEVLAGIADQAKGLALWSHTETGDPWSVARDERVHAWTKTEGIPWHFFQTEMSDGERLGPFPPPETMIAHGLTPGRIVSERILYLDDDPCAELPAGPRVAQRLIDDLLLLDPEGEERHAIDAAGSDFVAQLSAHLAWGTLSRRELRSALSDEDGTIEVASPVIANLVDALLSAPAATDRPEVETPNTPLGPDESALFAQWQAGRTGTPIIDAGMRALNARGWLRSDLMAACTAFAVGNLGLPATAVARHAARLRIDFSPARHADIDLEAASADDLEALSLRIDPACTFMRTWLDEARELDDAALHAPARDIESAG
ncbi:MAG: deoxyribodipyrimidine photo-lyase [Pseudomonadota bacterium]